MWYGPDPPILVPMSDTSGKPQNTAAFYGQAVASFGVAMAATAIVPIVTIRAM